MVKDTQTICRQQPTNSLTVFDHFLGLALKELKYLRNSYEKLTFITSWYPHVIVGINE